MHFVLAFAKSRFKIILVIIFLAVVSLLLSTTVAKSQQQPQVQTQKVEKGTLVSSISASGNISAANSVNITTTATGIISQVYVKNGDAVTLGQKIADITLDVDSEQKRAAAWASYLSARNQVESAKSKINSLQSAEFKANQKFLNDAVARGLAKDDPTYIQENADWLQAEADYKNQTGSIEQSQASLTSSWLSYQQISPVITALSAGVISNLTIAPGLFVGTKLGTILMPQGGVQAVVNLSEIDVAKVSSGQKVTLTLDAFPGKTFTGKILVVDTNGQTSSGVTTYPATIVLDSAEKNIFPNMAVSAKVITNVKDNIILIPSAAIQTSNGQSTVRTMKNGQIETIPVELGDANDTQTEVTFGLSENDLIVTSAAVTSGNRSQTQGGGSPFSAIGGGNRTFGGGGGGVRINTGR